MAERVRLKTEIKLAKKPDTDKTLMRRPIMLRLVDERVAEIRVNSRAATSAIGQLRGYAAVSKAMGETTMHKELLKIIENALNTARKLYS